MYPSKGFIILDLTFTSTFYLELISVYSVRGLIIFHVNIQLPQYHMFLPIELFWQLCQKSINYECQGYFFSLGTLNSIPFFSMLILVPNPSTTLLCYYSFMESFEMKKYESSNIFFKIILAILDLLHFLLNFRISVSIFTIFFTIFYFFQLLH